MSDKYEIEVYSQNSIYNKNNDIGYKRKLKVYFSTPEKGVNEETGVLLFIAGFGGEASSNIYKKMRDKFSDQYNLVTIQCDYFGYEFMQSGGNLVSPDITENELKKVFSNGELNEIYKEGHIDLHKLLELGSKYRINLEVKADLSKENINNFNDMGIMQAIDNITAVLSVMNILYDNNMIFNAKRTIIYGHSHGAYLAYLCNAFSPGLFSLIIDNSAWVYPIYLSGGKRFLFEKYGELTLITFFDYFANTVINDFEILNLPYIYSTFQNNCKIICYHGIGDTLIRSDDKARFCNKVDNCIFNLITEESIDNIMFKSTSHGLASDFIEVFNYTMKNFNISFKKDSFIDLPTKVMIETFKNKYLIDYKDIIPCFIIQK